MAHEPHFVVKYSSYLGTAIKLVLYILKQLFASVSVNSGGYLPRQSGSVNIHRYSPPLRRIIVNQSTILERISTHPSLVQILNLTQGRVLGSYPGMLEVFGWVVDH